MPTRTDRFTSGLTILAFLIVFAGAVPAGAQSQIFADGFESGDLSSWSFVGEQIPGSLEVNAAAAMGGSDFGLEVAGGGRAWVESRHPDREREVFVSFFFDPNNWEMLARGRVDVLRFTAQGRRHHLRLVLQRGATGQLRLGLFVRGNRGRYQAIGGGPVIAGQENLIEVAWQAASSRNGQDGSATLWINGELEASEPSLANGRLDVRSIQMGLVGGNTHATRGSFFLDDYSSFRTLAP